jgi:hypothetical protein
MKILPLLTLALALCFTACSHLHKPVVLSVPTKSQIKAEYATHEIVLQKNDEDAGQCTALAIAPHALMTAHHCNEDGTAHSFKADLTLQEEFHIQKVLTDGRDHDIYLVDGPAFQNFILYRVRPAKMGEWVYLWGDGGGEYPSRVLFGTVTTFFDPSEIDRWNGMVTFSMPVIPGDSGSAVFASSDDSIVAVTTYLWRGVGTTKTIDFTPNFTDDQLAEAESFAPDSNRSYPQEHKLPKPKLNDFMFGDPFGFLHP